MFFFNKYITIFWLQFTANIAGKDEQGNVYYEHKNKTTSNGLKKRFCIFIGICEPSRISPLWHNWLHYISNIIPSNNGVNYDWQKLHTPNLTGTGLEYKPYCTTKSFISIWTPEN
jgi:NADH:ubiquinone oxidoreductase subunit